MIRLSEEKDISGIVALWKESFGDTEEDIHFFLNAHYNPDNTLVYEVEGKMASVLFLLEGEMHIKGVDYPSYYLYAACTSAKYRGRGFMAKLLDFAKSISADRKKFFIALKPAEESLYAYYSKFGYKSVFTKKIATFTRLDCYNNLIGKNEILASSLSEIRNGFYSDIDYFKWDDKFVNFAFEHHKYFGGQCFIDCKGYILYTFNDEIMSVKETTFTQTELMTVADKLSENYKFNSISVDLPFNYDVEFSKTEIVNSGMLLPLCDDAESLINKIDNAYLALTLD